MKPTMFQILSTVCFYALTVLGAQAQSATALLAQVDDQRSFPDMSFQMQITSFDGVQPKDSTVLWGFVKLADTGNKTLIWFADPSPLKGRKMLMDGPTVYLLFPRTRNPIRLSPLQVLLGESSNGDVARAGFSQDYDVASADVDTRDGFACHRFFLEAKPSRKDAGYRKITLWVDQATLRPRAAEFFGGGDKLLKKASYRDYRTVGGKSLPFVMDIADGENPDKHTVMTYLKIGKKPVPDSVFRREYLEAWNPEAPQ